MSKTQNDPTGRRFVGAEYNDASGGHSDHRWPGSPRMPRPRLISSSPSIQFVARRSVSRRRRRATEFQSPVGHVDRFYQIPPGRQGQHRRHPFGDQRAIRVVDEQGAGGISGDEQPPTLVHFYPGFTDSAVRADWKEGRKEGLHGGIAGIARKDCTSSEAGHIHCAVAAHGDTSGSTPCSCETTYVVGRRWSATAKAGIASDTTARPAQRLRRASS